MAFGRQLGAKEVPKSSILAPGSIKSRKNDVPEGVLEKAWNFDGILVGKWRLGRSKIIDFSLFFSIESCFRRFSKNLINFMENGSQNASKNHNKSEIWRSRADFFDFGRILEESDS